MAEKVKRVAPLSPEAERVLAVMKEANRPLTLAEVKEVFPEANPSHFLALKNRNLVEASKVEVEVVSVKEVSLYSLK